MINKFYQSGAFKPAAMLMIIAIFCMSFTAPGGTVVIKSGTTIPLELMNTISSENATYGQLVNFKVTSDIKVDGKVIIPQGSMAKGQIVRVHKNGLLGSSGEIQINVTSVTAVDGTEVYLNGSSLNNEGQNRLGISIVITLLCILGFLIKGGNAEIAAGTSCLATVSGNTTVNVN